MILENAINSELFHADKIARELYDFLKPGVLAIPGFLAPEFCELAIADFRAGEALFKDAPLLENGTKQELRTYYCGEADNAEKERRQFPLVSRLKEEYSTLYKSLGRRAGFWQGAQINSVGIHWYAPGSIGMGIHRDYSNDINLISAFILSGNTPFAVYSDKSGSQRICEIETRPGMLVLMRGPRKFEEKEYRPYHEVSCVQEERFTILFRQKKSNGCLP